MKTKEVSPIVIEFVTWMEENHPNTTFDEIQLQLIALVLTAPITTTEVMIFINNFLKQRREKNERTNN